MRRINLFLIVTVISLASLVSVTVAGYFILSAQTNPYSSDWMGQMMGFNPQTMGRFGPGTGMMGAWTPPTELAPAGDSLTLDEATAIAKAMSFPTS